MRVEAIRSNCMRFPVAAIPFLLLASVTHAAPSGDAAETLSRQVRAYFVDMGRGDIASIEQVWVSEGGAWKMVTGQITLVKK